MSSADKRRHPRITLQLEVELCLPDQDPLTLLSGNLSDSGVYLQANGQPLPLAGSEVYLRLKGALGDGLEPPLVKARVVRVEENGLGLQFDTDDES